MYIVLDGNISHSYCDDFAALLIGKGIFFFRPSQVNRQGGPCLNTMLRHALRRNVRKNEQLRRL
ncbi:hypothetical protein Patl1_18729 [Pistacia atlantica]|uniref:Uncharacterized protein n=1 Tax=Pistacia atlantica TaxID=434234 RepID=A0ACC1BX54_9ROSI|nr:hypothetical protein Patl1_18729 [Pistacia atlantica]